MTELEELLAKQEQDLYLLTIAKRDGFIPRSVKLIESRMEKRAEAIAELES